MLSAAELLPLSLEQEWFFHKRLEDPDRRYSIGLAFEISGPLDTDAFIAAVELVFRKHSGLRVRLAFDEQGDPRQLTLPETAPVPLTCHAVRCDSRDQFQAYARAIARRDAVIRWDPARDPLCGLRLLRRTEDDHIFLATFDHLAFDHRAMMIFDAELWHAYAMLAGGEPGSAGAGRAEQASAAFAASSALEDALRRHAKRYQRRADTVNDAYWSRRFALTPPVWQPGGRRCLVNQPLSLRRRLHRSLPDALTRRLQGICQPNSRELFEIFVTAYFSVLFATTLQERLALFVPLDTRERDESDVIGMFASIVPLVVDREDGSLASLLGQVRREVLGAFVHSHLHGTAELRAAERQRAVWQLEPRRALSLNYIRADGSALAQASGAGLDVERIDYMPAAEALAAFLALVVLDLGDSLEVDLFYCQEVMDEQTASRLMTMLEAAVAELAGLVPEQSVPEQSVAEQSVPEQSVAGAAGSGPAELTALLDADGAVGLHADLAQVREALLSHELVTAAAVSARPGEEGQGTEIVARVTVSGPVQAEELQRYCRTWPAATQYLVAPRTVLITTAEQAAPRPEALLPDAGERRS